MFTRLLLIIVLACSSISVSAQVAETVIPLEGLDPVMLSQGKEVQGNMQYKVTRGQFQYIFANAENKAAFEKDPARYEIQLDGHCARMGSPTTGNPDLYTVHDGRIYIFGSEECQTAFKAAPEKYIEVPSSPKAPPSAEALKRGQELIAKAAATVGGPKLDQLRSLQRTDVRGNQVKNSLVVAFPDSLRQETIRPNFTLTSVITPSESFVVVNNAAARPMREDNRATIFKDLKHDPLILLRARTQPDFKTWRSAGAEDKTLEYVDVELATFTTTLGIDPQTGRVVSQTYRGRGPGGVVGQITISYSDFRTVEGLSLPFKATATFDGQPFPALSATTEALTINGQIDPSSFKKPR
ncbi:MAG TPA: hypothetical protein VFZ22_20360 [Pyrinomonadaceae bacterium]|nr:hypothetical protein [Pyrinomonadaceae bacterium]